MRRALLLALLAASACAGPRPEAPQAASVASPQGWRDRATPGAALDATWWQGFGDPVLAQLVERALANNVNIAIAASRVEQARAQFSLAQAQRLPNIGAGEGGQQDRHVNAFGRPVEEWATQGTVSISYDLDLFGRLRNASAAARANLLATQAAGDNVRLAIAASTAAGYITLRSFDARLKVLRDTLAVRGESLRLARRLTDAGYAPALDLRQAEAEYRATEQLIPATELAIRRQEDGLALLLGEMPGEIPRGGAFEALTLPPALAVLPSELLRRRPDIVQAEQQLVAADRSLDSVRAAFLPNIQLNGSGGYVSTTLIPDPFAVYAIGGSILQRIFDFGRLPAQQRGAAAQRDAAAYAYKQTALNAFREVEDALAGVTRAGEQQVALQQQRTAVAELLTLARNRYRAGYSPYLEQVNAERGLLGADLSLVEVRTQQLNAIVALYQALGGGWSESELQLSGK